jgi:hypothetical protein
LLREIGAVARIEPTAIYSRWPERNGELCARLAAAVTSFSARRRHERWRERLVPVEHLLERIEELLAERAEAPLDWCLGCDAVIGRGEHARDASLELVPHDPERSREVFRSFVAADDRPLDGRLLAREGERAVRERVERGDFGDGYRRAWKRALAEAAERELHERVRGRIAAARASGAGVDVYFTAHTVVLARRTSDASPPTAVR